MTTQEDAITVVATSLAKRWPNEFLFPDAGFTRQVAEAAILALQEHLSKSAEVRLLRTQYTISLTSVDPSKMIPAIKEVRTLTNRGLKEAKDLVESRLPVVLRTDATLDEVLKARRLFGYIGASVFWELTHPELGG
jgi:ribosomal protein L7/L12